MPYFAQVLAVLSMAFGCLFVFVSVFVLHTDEDKHNERAPATYLWPFNRTLREEYPAASRFARASFALCILASIPPMISMLV